MPETSWFLNKADQSLREAEAMLGIGLYQPAGRSAYLAAFHAAQAFIFESTARVLKTHKGVHAEFSRLAQSRPILPQELRSFLTQSYDLKATADYAVGPASELSEPEARQVLAKAHDFVAHIGRALEP